MYFYSDPIQSPGKHLERFPLLLPGFSGETTVLFWTFQKLFCANSHRNTETQKGQCWKGLPMVILSKSPVKVGSITADCSGSCPILGFNISRDGDTRTSLSSLPQPLTTYAVFAYMGFPMLQSMPIAFCPVTGHH